jgi:hypothetical protein
MAFAFPKYRSSREAVTYLNVTSNRVPKGRLNLAQDAVAGNSNAS